MLLSFVASNQVGVPPHNDGNCTTKDSPIASGLVRDFVMGGCKCADDDAEWTRRNSVGDNSEA